MTVPSARQPVVLLDRPQRPGANLHIVHAYDAPYSEHMRLCGMNSTAVEACVLSTEAAARESLNKLPAAAATDSRVHLHLERGNPLGILVTEIARYNPQIVVVGRRESERGQSPQEFSGSTGLRMASGQACRRSRHPIGPRWAPYPTAVIGVNDTCHDSLFTHFTTGNALSLLGRWLWSAVETPQKNEPPATLDATVKLSGGVLAAGIGYKWGHGTLNYQGQDLTG